VLAVNPIDARPNTKHGDGEITEGEHSELARRTGRWHRRHLTRRRQRGVSRAVRAYLRRGAAPRSASLRGNALVALLGADAGPKWSPPLAPGLITASSADDAGARENVSRSSSSVVVSAYAHQASRKLCA